jgi:hypothetical protein
MADDWIKLCALCGEFDASSGCVGGRHVLCLACVQVCVRVNNKLLGASDMPPVCPIGICEEFLRVDAAAMTSVERGRRLARLVRLEAVSAEYDRVAAHFGKSLPSTRIRNLFRVENAALRAVHEACNERMCRAAGDANRCEMFHATTRPASGSIIREGFDTHRAGLAHGTALGAGIYVADEARFSDGYSTPDAAGLRSMFLCSVLLGKNGENSKKSHGQCVVFREQQVLPIYLIQYV